MYQEIVSMEYMLNFFGRNTETPVVNEFNRFLNLHGENFVIPFSMEKSVVLQRLKSSLRLSRVYLRKILDQEEIESLLLSKPKNIYIYIFHYHDEIFMSFIEQIKKSKIDLSDTTILFNENVIRRLCVDIETGEPYICDNSHVLREILNSKSSPNFAVFKEPLEATPTRSIYSYTRVPL